MAHPSTGYKMLGVQAWQDDRYWQLGMPRCAKWQYLWGFVRCLLFPPPLRAVTKGAKLDGSQKKLLAQNMLGMRHSNRYAQMLTLLQRVLITNPVRRPASVDTPLHVAGSGAAGQAGHKMQRSPVYAPAVRSIARPPPLPRAADRSRPLQGTLSRQQAEAELTNNEGFYARGVGRRTRDRRERLSYR